MRLGALNLNADRVRFDSTPDVSVSSPVTKQKAAAAKQFIENHYKNYLQGLQDRKERYDSIVFHVFYWIWASNCVTVYFLATQLQDSEFSLQFSPATISLWFVVGI